MADGSVFNEKSRKKKPRIAFTGEEYGFGYLAVSNLLDRARRGGVANGGSNAVAKLRVERELGRTASTKKFDFREEQRLPLRSKDQALMAVKNGQADYALVPFYSPYSGYDYESLRSIANLFTLRGVEQIEATDQYCLAVHESQVLELAQSAHPVSGLSALLGRNRSDWGEDRPDYKERYPEFHGGGNQYRAGLKIDRAAQVMLRDRLDMVFAAPEALRRCKSKLDGLRTAGVEISETPNVVEPHRELARRARSTLSANRQTNTYFDPTTGETRFMSTMNGESQQSQLYGVILPFQVADMSQEYIIVDPDVEDSDPSKTRFMVVESNVDHTLYEDAYRTTDAKTRYWFRRAKSVADEADADGGQGVRVMMQFKRDGAAASIGDVTNYLRNYGVRHAVVRMDEDSEKDKPAPVVLDIEFDVQDFDHNISRRLRGSVANGAIKKAFQRWKNRGVLVIAAMPYAEPQLPKHGKRRWWNEAVKAWADDFVETMFIRATRILVWSLPIWLLAAAYFAWRIYSG